jgi:glycosyltransferase involved in cell wall biosynthesis
MLAIEYLRLHKRRFYIEVDGGMIANDSALKYSIKRHFVSTASGWFSSGKNTTDYLVHYGATRENCYVYPFTSLRRKGIEEAASGNRDRAAAKFALNISERRMILSVGRFIHGKGFDILLKAAAMLPYRMLARRCCLRSSAARISLMSGMPCAASS